MTTMETTYENIIKKVIIAIIFLILNAAGLLAANRVTIDARNKVELTSFTSERYVPLTTGTVYLTMEWRSIPTSATELASFFNQYLSSYGVTASAYLPTTTVAQVTFTRSSSASESLDIVIQDYSGTKTLHWLDPEDEMTTDANWIETRVYNGTGSSDYYTDITYYNGLGLPEMHVSGAASGNGRSVITPVRYDACLRTGTIVCLPFEGPDVSLKKVADSDAALAYESLYGADADYAFTSNAYDSYSLNRQTSSIKPGIVGRDRSKAATVEYGVSTTADKVLNLQYNEATCAINVSTVPAYLTGLDKTVYKDENDKVVIRFTDNLGREVLSRQLTGTSEYVGLDTYTVYDGCGRPVWVISPKGSSQLGPATSFTTSSSLANDYSTLYKYDERGRMIERKLSGRAVEYYVYDAGDRLVMYQDGNLRTSGNKWIHHVFDAMGREIEKTIVTPRDASMTVQNIRNIFYDVQYCYPALNGATDYRVPVSPTAFTCNRQLHSARYGNQSYRTGTTSATSVSTFTVPSYLSFAVVSGVVTASDRSTDANNLKVYEKLWISGEISDISATYGYVERAFYYDVFGRVIQVVERDPWGNTGRVSYKYDRLGNVLASKETRILPATTSSSTRTLIKSTICTYDSRGRLLTETTAVSGTAAGSSPVTGTVSYGYDELGRLKSITTGNGVETVRTYTTQGWGQGQRTVTSSGSAVFSQDLFYQDCGLVETVTSRQGTSASLSFGVTYDRAGRMTEWSQSGSNAFAEKNITYDANGNILTLKRYGPSAAVTSDCSYTYSGNRMTSHFNGASGTSTFGYDANGNMVSDSRNSIRDISYNELNLPYSVSFGSSVASYFYLSDGTKIAVLDNGSGYLYMGSIVCCCAFSSGASSVDFESTGFSAGRMVKKNGSVGPEYHVNDYLCSVRVVTDYMGRVLERNDYSGFGKRLDSSTGSTNRYRFSGKEEQGFAGLPWQDFGARMYDPDLARWTTQDPLADQYLGISPYAYCNNNPVNYIDPDGRDIWEIARNGNITRKEHSDEHRLYAIDSYNKRSSDYVIVKNPEVLIQLEGKGSRSYTSENGLNDVVNVFKFAADNSDVEWALHQGNNTYSITTKNEEESAGNWEDYGIGKPVATIHSHPNIPNNELDEIFSMGFLREGPGSARALIGYDWYNVRNDVNKNGSKARKSYVYFPESKNIYYITYNGPKFVKKW